MAIPSPRHHSEARSTMRTKMQSKHDPGVARTVQVLACIAIVVVAGMSISTGREVAQQIQRLVLVDEDRPQQDVHVAGAAGKLRGMLGTGLALMVLIFLLCNITLYWSSTWLRMDRNVRRARSHGQTSSQIASWTAALKDPSWDSILGSLWMLFATGALIFRYVTQDWVASNHTMELVLLDGIACMRCPYTCGCHITASKAAVSIQFGLLRATYYISLILVANCWGFAKLPRDSNSSNEAGLGPGTVPVMHVAYSELPQQAASVAALLQLAQENALAQGPGLGVEWTSGQLPAVQQAYGCELAQARSVEARLLVAADSSDAADTGVPGRS